MDLGICLPQCGALADTDLIAPFAQAGEIAGYDSLWEMERVLDPIGVMTVAALATTRVRIFGSVDQIADDLEATRRAGADEIILGEWEDPQSVSESAGPIDRVVSAWGIGPAPGVPHFESIAASR